MTATKTEDPPPKKITYHPPKCILGAVCDAMEHFGVNQTWPYFCKRCDVSGRIGDSLGWGCWCCGETDRVLVKAPS